MRVKRGRRVCVSPSPSPEGEKGPRPTSTGYRIASHSNREAHTDAELEQSWGRQRQLQQFG